MVRTGPGENMAVRQHGVMDDGHAARVARRAVSALSW